MAPNNGRSSPRLSLSENGAASGGFRELSLARFRGNRRTNMHRLPANIPADAFQEVSYS